jgi:glyoxylase-like metal-dependent hydrolase (beta-lactamase superfamily II)
MPEQIPVPPDAVAPTTDEDGVHELLPDLAWQRLAIVNVVFVGRPGGRWVLVDAGLPGSAGAIRGAAARRFGEGARPEAIVMTHGHFDHAGALVELADGWGVPVLAHALEVPYLDGSAAYPPPDPSVGGGMMAAMSRLYPRGPVDVGMRLRLLPSDGTVPFMPGWTWGHTPGHTPGHVSFWREADRTLIAGDAFITTRQESAYAVAMQKPEMHGPPAYYTQDWEAARRSVELLAALEPERAVTGHGYAMHGPALREALHRLARDFDHVAVPKDGTYVRDPADVASGRAYASPNE